MQIKVRGPAALMTHQMRAYAEYRLFAALARFGRNVRAATINLEPDADVPGVICRIDVDLGPDGHVRCLARQRHSADAIENAAERAGMAIGRRTRSAVSS